MKILKSIIHPDIFINYPSSKTRTIYQDIYNIIMPLRNIIWQETLELYIKIYII
jgi:hypothetical protein